VLRRIKSNPLMSKNEIIRYFATQLGRNHISKRTVEGILNDLLCKGKVIISRDGNRWLYQIHSMNNYLIISTEKKVRDVVARKRQELQSLPERLEEIEIEASLVDGDPQFQIASKTELITNHIREINQAQSDLNLLAAVFPHRANQHRELKASMERMISYIVELTKKDSESVTLYNRVLKQQLRYDSPILLDPKFPSKRKKK
ncbi:MAG: hypothetical protein ACREBU_16025, partial [Nitrososphaera sp.]